MLETPLDGGGGIEILFRLVSWGVETFLPKRWKLSGRGGILDLEDDTC